MLKLLVENVSKPQTGTFLLLPSSFAVGKTTLRHFLYPYSLLFKIPTPSPYPHPLKTCSPPLLFGKVCLIINGWCFLQHTIESRSVYVPLVLKIKCGHSVQHQQGNFYFVLPWSSCPSIFLFIYFLLSFFFYCSILY